MRLSVILFNKATRALLIESFLLFADSAVNGSCKATNFLRQNSYCSTLRPTRYAPQTALLEGKAQPSNELQRLKPQIHLGDYAGFLVNRIKAQEEEQGGNLLQKQANQLARVVREYMEHPEISSSLFDAFQSSVKEIPDITEMTALFAIEKYSERNRTCHSNNKQYLDAIKPSRDLYTEQSSFGDDEAYCKA